MPEFTKEQIDDALSEETVKIREAITEGVSERLGDKVSLTAFLSAIASIYVGVGLAMKGNKPDAREFLIGGLDATLEVADLDTATDIAKRGLFSSKDGETVLPKHLKQET